MGTYDFQQATADRIASIFREATVGENNREKKTGGQRRVLLADEVGLGKTIMAREVISRVRELRKTVGDDMFRVVYVCSNMNIVRQNIANLGIREKLEVSESRLSMQHLIISKKDRELKKVSGGEMPEMIIPLTPGTSFSQKGSGIGNMPERALMAVVLSRMDGLTEFNQHLRNFFRSKVVKETSEGWQRFLDRYDKEVDEMGEEYISDVKEKLRSYPEYEELNSRLRELFMAHEEWQPEHNRVINGYRRIFADLSLSMLEPDLIIMDEFQRFSSLLDYKDDSEQSAIVKKFFEQEGGQEPMILLLSATPYKPFSTLEELVENNADEHYEDFNRLMEFLFKGGNRFQELWSDYSHKLSHLKTEKFDVILASKNEVEATMYEGVCRTERLNEGLISTSFVEEVPISQDDILAYCEMQKIVRSCKEVSEEGATTRFHWSNMPVEYVKSSPYLLSFMDSYELKKQISAIYEKYRSRLPKPNRLVLLRGKDINDFGFIPMQNARMEYLKEMMMPEKRDAELLLWVPASKPYYETDKGNPFEKNKDFSKALVFSAWEMVPRMISVLLTYVAERKIIIRKGRSAEYDGKKGSDRLRERGKKILTYPSDYLSNLYDIRESKGKPIEEIKREIREKLARKLEDIPMSKRGNTERILALLQWLEGESEIRPEVMPDNTIDFLTNMAVAGPGVCLYRILKDKEVAKNVALEVVPLFQHRIAGFIIDNIQRKYKLRGDYLDGILQYCVLGNFQAVLDEYHHLCASDEDFIERMKEAFIREVPLQVDTFESFYDRNVSKKPMRTYYAVPFTKGKKSLDEKEEQRSNNVRIAFQSPFYPFVVTSTSVGQEGLDFHWYCRKIVHWNLPSNPQDLEQREGRINRYKCLAIRRNLAHRFPEIYSWDALFEEADKRVREEFGSRYSQMVPNWCLPVEWIKIPSSSERRDEIATEWIERIVPQYPMSSDITRYKRLIDVLSLYRLTMGQPRQEELVEMLETLKLTPEQISELLFNLSPIKRQPS